MKILNQLSKKQRSIVESWSDAYSIDFKEDEKGNVEVVNGATASNEVVATVSTIAEFLKVISEYISIAMESVKNEDQKAFENMQCEYYLLTDSM